MKKLILFLFLLSPIHRTKSRFAGSFFLSLLLLTGNSLSTIRYVSHSGTDTPPYLTWETAADSIMSAVNISSFGDTIYVANGVYEEQVVMIPGLSLIGAGMDSCIIDTRNLAYDLFHAVTVGANCFFQGFRIIVSYNSNLGFGIYGTGNSKILMNKVSNGDIGISLGSGPVVYKNICTENICGIYNFNAVVRQNIIVNNMGGEGVWIDASSPSYVTVTDSNFIQVTSGVATSGGFGIKISYGTKPTISNNTIILNDPNGVGIQTGFASDTTKIFNNLIIAERGYKGISNTNIPILEYNNYLTGNFDDLFHEVYVIRATSNSNIIKNNIVTNVPRAIQQAPGVNAVIMYNNSWNNGTNYGGFTPDSTNLSLDPMVINDDSTKGELDFHLQMFSPLIDRGDPTILDKDGTRSDIGLYGGPYGESYKYLDLPPRIPVNLSGTIDSIYILFRWNKNTEADFSHYNLFRDTTENFTVDSTTFVASIPDTFYQQIIPQGIDNLYFKLTAVDNQGNQSDPSEELHIFLTGINNKKQITISNYRLYQNYPNPFNPTTKIGYRLKERGYVKLYVYDIKGELVETLVNKYQEGGYYEIEFTGRNLINQIPNLASGIYIYQLMVSNSNNIPVFSDVMKMVYVK